MGRNVLESLLVDIIAQNVEVEHLVHSWISWCLIICNLVISFGVAVYCLDLEPHLIYDSFDLNRFLLPRLKSFLVSFLYIYFKIFNFFDIFQDITSKSFFQVVQFACRSVDPEQCENRCENRACHTWVQLSHDVKILMFGIRENSSRIKLRHLVHKDLLVRENPGASP